MTGYVTRFANYVTSHCRHVTTTSNNTFKEAKPQQESSCRVESTRTLGKMTVAVNERDVYTIQTDLQGSASIEAVD